MRHFKPSLPLLFFALLYWGCQKSDTANHASTPMAVKPTTTTINVPENVPAKIIVTDSLITNFQQLSALIASSSGKIETDGINSPQTGPVGSATYGGYTKTYDCSTNDWTYVFTWTINGTTAFHSLAGSGALTIGAFSSSAPFQITHTVVSLSFVTYTVQYTITAPNDANYCNNTTLQEMISFTYNLFTTPESGAASNTESADPNVYQTYNDLVAGFSPNGNGTFTLDVVPGVTVCGSACHISALGFPPTVTFYYSLEGSGTWQSYSQAGTDLNEFFLTLPQAGTYDYYTQEDTSPGVSSGQLGGGSITVQ
jgi:hypothetical protein